MPLKGATLLLLLASNPCFIVIIRSGNTLLNMFLQFHLRNIPHTHCYKSGCNEYIYHWDQIVRGNSTISTPGVHSAFTHHTRSSISQGTQQTISPTNLAFNIMGSEETTLLCGRISTKYVPRNCNLPNCISETVWVTVLDIL